MLRTSLPHLLRPAAAACQARVLMVRTEGGAWLRASAGPDAERVDLAVGVTQEALDEMGEVTTIEYGNLY